MMAAARRQQRLIERLPAVRGRLTENAPLAGSASGSVCLTAAGGPAAGSKTVHHSAALPCSAPAARWRVWRIQSARAGRPGSASRALRNHDS